MKQEEFLKMDKEDLFTFLASDKIVLESEEQVFECILSWIDHDRTHRSGIFQDLMDYVRFSNISSGYLVTKILNEPLFNEFLNRQNENSTPSLGSLSSEPRQYLRSVMPVVMGGLYYTNGRRTGLWSVEGLDISTNTWSSLRGMPGKRYHCGAAVVGHKVYVMGGLDNNGYSRSVCMYDPSENIWSDFTPSMREKRYDLGVAALNDKIYAVGGENMEAGWNGSSGKLNTAEVLDLTEGGTQEWRNIANMNTARTEPAVGALNGKIFSVGGNDGKETLKSVEAYDPEKNVWSPVADMSV